MKNYSLGLSLLAFILLQACSGNNGPGAGAHPGMGENEKTSVETWTVEKQDISRQIRSFGTVRAQDIVQITPQVSNRITRIYAELGDTVRQGEILAKIYDATIQEQLQQAQAQLQQSRIAFQRDSAQYARQIQLYEEDLISKAELESAKATVESSRAQLQSAQATLVQNREALENTVIRSPVYGVVLTRNVAAGDLASSGQVAFEIGNITGLETSVYLPLNEWERVEVGQKVNFTLSNEIESPAQGRVTHISPRLDPTTGLGEVIIAFTQKGPSIYQGVLVETIINVETHENAVVVPRSALVENVQTLIEPESNTIQIERNYSVFVVQGDSLALQRKVKLGIQQGDKIEILQGLQGGDEIVITGQTSLEDSTHVRVASANGFQKTSVPLSDTKERQNESQPSRGGQDSANPNNK